MKFTTFLSKGQARLGVVDGADVIDLNAAQPQVPADLRAALAAGIDLAAAGQAAIAGSAPRLKLADLSLAPLVPEPGKIICLGLNYFDHAKEGGREKPEYPWFFLRSASSLLAAGGKALRPRVSVRFDYEAEVAVVIGKTVKHATLDNALDAVFGYTCFNDMSVRDYQKKTPQWSIGKNFDRTGGFGPVLVTADELPPGASELRIQTRLNGQVMQDANTRDMIWGVAETIKLITECMTLEPGDVIVMGTPAGVGQARTPQVWMKHGDTVEIEIERIGVLSNLVEDEAA
ncbi:fumarylacetoacetate hydrolase family protein [Polaromonas eurypsychrophila]|uniref:5-oxopent-3-ene-1,2,5-tricarboxylate decarboxylase n=1 Tax=Polaromonas eurypsychrophila TaxID=1614635 RepID=A0A916WE23_9BURK|nr:fumarylacetoacetate hydrolase family protein [Polaromonas eurypsychrophila]GGA90182.1 5-oxopent-3-ene-1,2,5-tricarboxylate decarboxylase [Polaromonas eurypsychrophila]